MPSPDRHRSSRGSPISNNHKVINLQQPQRLSIWAPYHDTTPFQKEMTYPKGRDPHNLAATFLIQPFPGCWGPDEVSSTKLRFLKKPCFGSNKMINLWSQRYKIKQMIISQMIKHWSSHSNTQHATLPNWDISLINFNYITSELVRLREGC